MGTFSSFSVALSLRAAETALPWYWREGGKRCLASPDNSSRQLPRELACSCAFTVLSCNFFCQDWSKANEMPDCARRKGFRGSSGKSHNLLAIWLFGRNLLFCL